MSNKIFTVKQPRPCQDQTCLAPAHLDVVVRVQQDVGRFKVEMKEGRVHAVQEVHPHRRLVDDTETQLPGQRLRGQQSLQRARLHVFHHQSLRIAADAVYGQDVAELSRLHLFGLL